MCVNTYTYVCIYVSITRNGRRYIELCLTFYVYVLVCACADTYIYVCMYVSNGGNAFHQSGIQICVTIHVYKHGYACANPCIYVCMYVLDVGKGRR